MIGLTWGDKHFERILTFRDYAAIISNLALWGVYYLFQTDTRIIIILSVIVSLLYLYDRQLSIDNKILFRECTTLSRATPRQFMGRYYKRPFLEYQTPFIPFLFSRLPDVGAWQIMTTPLVMLTLWIGVDLWGREAGLVFGTPLLTLFLWQPSTDLFMFFFGIVGLWCVSQGFLVWASFSFLVASLCKPLFFLVFPVFFWRLEWSALIVIVGIGGYYLCGLWLPAIRHQIDFILNQLYLRRLPALKRIAEEYSLSKGLTPLSWREWVWNDLRYRGNRILWPMLSSLPVFLFPAYLCKPSFVACFIGMGIMGLYSNVKYFVLVLLLWRGLAWQ